MKEKEKEIDLFGEGISYFARFRTDGGSCKLYTQEYVDSKGKEIERLNKKCEILEENNKLLIQQKAQMYEDLDRYSNIIQELERWLKSKIDYFDKTASDNILHEQMVIEVIYGYIQELKERK